MSTYLSLACLDHDPPLVAEDESGQHEYDLPDIRADLRDRDVLVRLWYADPGMQNYFRNHTCRFLARHRDCRIGIVSEYGDWYATTGDDATRYETPEQASDASR